MVYRWSIGAQHQKTTSDAALKQTGNKEINERSMRDTLLQARRRMTGTNNKSWIIKDTIHSFLCIKKGMPHFEVSLLDRAENETRTRDLNLGKVALYQLSYFRLQKYLLPIHQTAKFYVPRAGLEPARPFLIIGF